MKLVVGLGNPGDRYKYTRHNSGFLILDAYVSKKLPNGVVWLDETKFRALICRLPNALLVKPQTYMNKVGECVAKLVNYYSLNLNDVLVIHDDVDLPLGEAKLKKASGTAGHHGVEDIVSKLGTINFWRLRVGVGRPPQSKFDVEDYVLEKFAGDELKGLSDLFERELFERLENFLKDK